MNKNLLYGIISILAGSAIMSAVFSSGNLISLICMPIGILLVGVILSFTGMMQTLVKDTD